MLKIEGILKKGVKRAGTISVERVNSRTPKIDKGQ